jgi:hypothetical protein
MAGQSRRQTRKHDAAPDVRLLLLLLSFGSDSLLLTALTAKSQDTEQTSTARRIF